MHSFNFIEQIHNALLRLNEVKRVTGLSRSGIYAGIKNRTFPRPVAIGLRAVAWRSEDIQAWLDSLSSKEANHA